MEFYGGLSRCSLVSLPPEEAFSAPVKSATSAASHSANTHPKPSVLPNCDVKSVPSASEPAGVAATTFQDEPHGPTSIFHQHRLDYERIVELVPPGASVLDLGCGSGALLCLLQHGNHRRFVGVGLDEI